MPETLTKCSNCGDAVSSAGRSSSTGDRYCTKKRECIAAKQRAAYARRLEGQVRKVEDRPCSCCRQPMTTRSWRSTDSELGRWCRRKDCQNHRSLVETNAKRNSPEMLAQREEIMRGAFQNATVETCRDCGRTDARRGWVHPTPENKMCQGSGENMPPMDLAKALWMPSA